MLVIRADVVVVEIDVISLAHFRDLDLRAVMVGAKGAIDIWPGQPIMAVPMTLVSGLAVESYLVPFRTDVDPQEGVTTSIAEADLSVMLLLPFLRRRRLDYVSAVHGSPQILRV